jgi:hypothetical protein
MLIKLLCFWTLSIVLFLFKTQCFGDDSIFAFRWNLLSWAQSIGLILTSETLCVLNKKRTMDNVQKHNNCITILKFI